LLILIPLSSYLFKKEAEAILPERSRSLYLVWCQGGTWTLKPGTSLLIAFLAAPHPSPAKVFLEGHRAVVLRSKDTCS
jgi:hypothetical protein